MKRVILFETLAFSIALLLCLTVTVVVPAQNEVYLLPRDSSSVQAGDRAEVEVRVNATGFKSGEINLTYDSWCANVTAYVWDATNFPLSGWTHYDGREKITFAVSQPALTGNYQIGTLTIQCVSAGACGTRVIFAEPSALFDPQGHELQTSWIDGSFTCTSNDDLFDTGPGTYPSIRGMHNGTITPSHDIIANKIYTYPCPGTGGHSEEVMIYNNERGPVAEAHWSGYTGDYHNITFDTTFTLLANHTYNYTIRTGSYPQIHHNRTLTTSDGVITCSDFVDANGNVYNDRIPAIRLFR